MFAYLALQLCHLGVRNSVATADRLYFVHDGRSFYIIAVAGGWTLIGYTYQHNAPSVLNSAEIVRAGDWHGILKALASPI